MSQRRIKSVAGSRVDPEVRYEIIVQHLWNGQTRVKAPTNQKLCEAMLKDGWLAIQQLFKPRSEEEEKATGLVITADPKIVVPH